MSSIRGGATGAGKPKLGNVNSVYTGRNLSSQGKAPGKHGLQTMHKGLAAAVRRMPPPPTLPSMKAENNGQDPMINIVPQAGTGWTNSTGGAAEPPRPAATGPVPGNDLRPTWAKPAGAPALLPAQPPTSSREFPTLSVSAQEKEQKPSGPWTSGSPQAPGRTLSGGSQSLDDEHTLPTRYYDGAKSGNYRSRFQGSNDARASQPGFMSRADSGRERGDSTCDSVGDRSDVYERRDRSFSEKSFGEAIEEEPPRPKAAPIIEEEAPRTNGHHPAPTPQYSILKRPQHVLPEEDDEEQVQLTKLNKPSALPLSRRGPGGEKTTVEMEESPQLVKSKPYNSEPRAKREPYTRREERPSPTESPNFVEPVVEKKVEDVVPAPPPAENVWEKRKEERESQEKEKVLPKSYQKAIEHHFPTAADAVSVKVDKDTARKPIDSDFTRDRNRALRAPVSNDVRSTMRREEERRQFSRDDYADREFTNRYNRYTREHSDLGDYRQQRPQRPPVRERYNEDETPEEEAELRRNEYLSRQEGHTHRGRGVPKVMVGRGRGGRGRPAHSTVPQYQIRKRPQHNEDELEEAENVVPAQEKPAETESVDVPMEKIPQQAEDIQESKSVHHERQYNSSRGRGGVRGRGRGEHRRQYPAYNVERSARPRVETEEETVEKPVKNYNSRGGYQPRGKRGQGQRAYTTRLPRPDSTQRSSEEPSLSIEDNRLKSPVVSSEGHEEYETASEGSNRIQRKEKTPEKRASKKLDRAQPTAERIRSKNGQPARRTYRSPSDANSRREPEQKKPNMMSTDGLAGLDISNFSKVVTIDDHLQETAASDGPDDFEEVMNKKMKRQKQLEEQLRQQVEERKRQKEKERLEKLQTKKEARKAAIKDAKTKAKEEKAKILEERKKAEDGSDEKRPKKEIQPKTVWNSAHMAALEQEKRVEENKLPSHIPSPIARPTPKAKVSVDLTKDEKPGVEMPASSSSGAPADNFDFTFDPAIHQAQNREQKAKILSTVALSESGSTADDYGLKEKLHKVKDLWSGEGEKEAGSREGDYQRVAKVKPQPQGGEPSAAESGKEATVTTSGQSMVPRSPSITPFSTAPFGGIPFPNYLSDMGSSSHYGHNSSMGPLPNAASPPALNTGYMGQRPGQRSFMDNNMYNPVPQRQPSMWAPTAQMDSLIPFSNAPPVQQHNSGQFGFNGRPQQAPQMQRAFPPPSSVPQAPQQQQQQHKMGGLPMMFAPPLDMMSMSMPPPSNPHMAPSQRADRPFQSLMTNSFNGPPPPQFNQPPPTMGFVQPPPSFGHDISWTSTKQFGNQQMGGQFRGQMSRPPPPAPVNDVWSNMTVFPYTNTQQHHGSHQQRMFNHGINKNRSDKSSSGQPTNGTSA